MQVINNNEVKKELTNRQKYKKARSFSKNKAARSNQNTFKKKNTFKNEQFKFVKSKKQTTRTNKKIVGKKNE